MVLEYYISPSTDLYYNLALEEYLVRNIDFSNRKILLIYSNDLSIVLGKNQNVLKEINYAHFLENNIKLGRRISGGGTVVHDLGNINFAFLESMDFKKINQYQNSSGLIVNAINNLGVSCFLNARNAIFLNNERKISGSAQFSCSNGVLSHLTVLFQSDLVRINQILRPNNYIIDTKASGSVSSLVDNLGNYLNISKIEFINKTLDFLGYQAQFNIEEVNKFDLNSLILNKYSTQEYIYDTSCNGTLSIDNISLKFNLGKIEEVIGLENLESYKGKRLLYDEINENNTIWTEILHKQ